MLGTQEHYDILDFFDKTHKGLRLDKEPKELWRKGFVYQHGEVNELYRAFIAGYAFGKVTFNQETIV